VREAHGEFTRRGTGLVAVGTGAAFQARELMEQGMPFPCLVDPAASLHRVLGFGRVGWRLALRADTYTNYLRAWRRGARQGAITGDPRRLSGVAIVDAAGKLAWRYAARTIGDYPPLATLLAALDGVV
jgi:AhpC/TSA antioxidant enzyme